MRHIPFSKILLSVFFLLGAAGAGPIMMCDAPPTFVTKTIVATRNIVGPQSEYDVRFTIRNNTEWFWPGFVMKAVSTRTDITLVEDEVIVGGIEPLATKESPDTVTVRAPDDVDPRPYLDSKAVRGLSCSSHKADCFQAENTLGASGGTVTPLNGKWGVTFRSMSSGTWAQVWTTKQEGDRAPMEDTLANLVLPRELRVQAGVQPTAAVTIWTTLPAGTVLPPGSSWRMYYRSTQGNEEEENFPIFEAVPATVLAGGRLQAEVPAAAFEAGGFGSSWEAIIVVGAQPIDPTGGRLARVANLQSRAAATGADAQIACPLSNCVSTSGFSPSRTVGGVTRAHRGIDLRADIGTPIYAVADGVVVNSYKSSSYGETIWIWHDGYTESRSAHLSSRLVNQYDLVQKGDLIGYSGCTGRCFGPHLHFEWRTGEEGVAVDPWPLLLVTRTVKLTGVILYGYDQFSGAANGIEWDGGYVGAYVEYYPRTFTITTTPGVHRVTFYIIYYYWLGINIFDVSITGGTFPGGVTIQKVPLFSNGLWGGPEAITYDITVP